MCRGRVEGMWEGKRNNARGGAVFLSRDGLSCRCLTEGKDFWQLFLLRMNFLREDEKQKVALEACLNLSQRGTRTLVLEAYAPSANIGVLAQAHGQTQTAHKVLHGIRMGLSESNRKAIAFRPVFAVCERVLVAWRSKNLEVDLDVSSISAVHLAGLRCFSK